MDARLTAVNRVYERGLELSARAIARHPALRRLARDVEVEHGVRYSPAFDLRVDVYLPRRPGTTTVLYVHGGGFRNLSRSTHVPHALALASRGARVLVPDYRLAPRAPFPAALEDLAGLLEWLAHSGPARGIDPERLAWAGESAGANLVCALAISCAWDRPERVARRIRAVGIRPRALLPACGLLQVTDPTRIGGTSLVRRLTRLRMAAIAHGYLGADARAHDLADPIVLLERGDPPVEALAPLLAACGSADPLIGDTERLAAAWARLGGSSRLLRYAGAGHAFQTRSWRPQAQRFWDDQVDFVRRHACGADTRF